MPATTAVKHAQASGMKHHQRNISHGKLNRSASAIRFQGGQLPGVHSNFAVTALKAKEDLVKRSESSNTIKSDHTVGHKAVGFHGRGHLAPRKTSHKLDSSRKAKFLMAAERDASPGDEEEDDDDQWISSGVVTPDDREPDKTVAASELPFARPSTPKATMPQAFPPNSHPVPASTSVPTGLPDELNQKFRSNGHKTAPSSRAPSIRGRSSLMRPLSTVSVHDTRPSLIRTSSFTPTAPPLTTTSIASAQITPTNPQLDDSIPPHHYTPIHTSPPGSPSSSRTRQQGSRSSFFRRSSTSSSLRSSLTLPSFAIRDRKPSVLSDASTTVQSAKQFPHASAAFNSLSAIPRGRSAPPPLVSHFPPIPVRTPAEEAFGLFPPPYLAAHMAVRAHESPLQDSFARVVSLRVKGHPMAISGN
ncbi:uncharacterized protein EI90DRAFT_3287740 [Cantharellus anzutake]|uniref:uncharacterized protein n=1 Tax=Cantharellus anzutake TaxID=1750568 RepID=UPI001904D465|nr:uncharacterized protein EI90DRAFT_3287740 [Cantharellus anzutake]KAF8335828.1 hypothetical protein EI90DRAFT_3287740 [Cantharellus anzutake]